MKIINSIKKLMSDPVSIPSKDGESKKERRETIAQLKELKSFLKGAYTGASFVTFNMHIHTEALEKAISYLADEK